VRRFRKQDFFFNLGVLMIWPLMTNVLTHFVSFAFVVTMATWVSLLVGSVLTFIIRTDHGQPRTFRGFMAFFLPAEIIRRKSCRIDAVFWVFNRITTPLIMAPLLVGGAFCSALTYRALSSTLGVHPQHPQSWLVWTCVAVVVTLAADFATFYTHWLDHKITVMWEFHKVHHAADFLIPITNKRFHPVQQVFDNGGVAVITGVAMGAFAYFFSMPIYDNTVIGIDTYFLVNALSFYHLRHSHIPMAYGRLEKWLLSPAQHQLHHSREDRHWDKNFGLFLSVWDRMFGTLLYSEPPGSYQLGLPNNEGRAFQSVWQLYVTPFTNIWRLRNKQSAAQPRPDAADGPVMPA
jgi:sterol desaturase/sphingolipid hydroxylase (fatty acid hydroxylase superfamily)